MPEVTTAAPAGQVPRDEAFWRTFDAVLEEQRERTTEERQMASRLAEQVEHAAAEEVRAKHRAHYCTEPGHCADSDGEWATPWCQECGPDTPWPCPPRLALRLPFLRGGGPGTIHHRYRLVAGRTWSVGDPDPRDGDLIGGTAPGMFDRYGFVWHPDISVSAGRPMYRCPVLCRNRAWERLLEERGPLREMRPPDDGLFNLSREREMRRRDQRWYRGERVST